MRTIPFFGGFPGRGNSKHYMPEDACKQEFMETLTKKTVIRKICPHRGWCMVRKWKWSLLTDSTK